MKGRHKTHCLCSFLGNCLFLSHGDTKGWREKFKINLHFHFPQQLGKLSEIYGAFFISPVHNESFVVKIINHVVGSGLLECGCQGTGWNISISGEAESAATWPTQDQYNPANRGMGTRHKMQLLSRISIWTPFIPHFNRIICSTLSFSRSEVLH